MDGSIPIGIKKPAEARQSISSESYNNFTPGSWGTPYHVPEFAFTQSASRSRTVSNSSEAVYRGVVKKFSRSKGHGFIEHGESIHDLVTNPLGIANPIYFHVSDINDENIPKESDPCTFRVMSVPPRNTSGGQAVDIKLMLTKEQASAHKQW